MATLIHYNDYPCAFDLAVNSGDTIHNYVNALSQELSMVSPERTERKEKKVWGRGTAGGR